ncbi:MAG: PAS domain-containing protein [Campylobacteraceae bacterium]|nr:PAS domain-containing protein [Campylobacteraceae bacterium]
MTRKKFSLTLINSLSIIIFLIVVSFGISFWAYFSTEKVLNHNLKQFFNQTKNLTNIIVENEKKNLDEITFKISKILEKTNKDKDTVGRLINDSISTDQVDLLYLEKNDELINFSNSLFDTDYIIKKISEKRVKEGNIFLLIENKDDVYLILLSSKKIINQDTGRVKAKLYAGKILNDNFAIVSNIKQNASLVDVYIYYENYLIATTAKNEIENIQTLKDKEIIKEDKKIYFNEKVSISNDGYINVIYIINNSSISLLKNDFIKAGLLLLLFVIASFSILYIFTNRYFIKPFSKLLNFAKESKDNKLVIYEQSNILEFDNFAINLKEIIDELRDLKEQYARAIEGVQDGLWDLDLVNNSAYYSRRYLEMLGYNSLDEVDDIKNFWKKSVHPADYKNTLKKLAKHLRGETSFYQDHYRFKCKNGSYRWLRIRGKIFFDIEGKPIRMTGFHTDVDEVIKLQKDNKKKEQMIYQQSKLASMGEMIGNIAHQWRQPLNVISTISSSQIMQIELNIDKKEETIKNLEKIVNTVQYLSTIIDKFRNFFNPNKELELFNIEDVIKENIEIFETSYKSHGIYLQTDLTPVNIKGYKFELMQVVINLINNAKDAILTTLKPESKKYIFMKNYIKDDKIIIKVSDNAGGIKDKLKDKIYEPYFTTKHKSQGTGLGLYMSSEIIKKHFDGEINNETIVYEFENNKYKGEEFTIVIPININQ